MSERLSTAERVLADNVFRARSPLKRIRGLLGRKPLLPGEALMLEPAAQVHTFGMSYAIDVVFCDGEMRVLHIERSMAPWRVTRWVRGARVAFELPAGSLPGAMEVGERLTLSEGSRPVP